MALADRGMLRARDGGEARVTFEELFFDLVYVFAVTQISHLLLHHLTPHGALEALVLWFGVWLVWQYTCWVTNWFDPGSRPIRVMLFAVMLVSLVMAAAIPGAFGERGLVFALCLAGIQVGRTLFVLACVGRHHALTANWTRILCWSSLAACFWIGGAFVQGDARLGLWAIAVLCEYVSPMFGFYVPALGRSDPASEWTIEGGHLAERCQLFVIVALGETVLVTGATFAEIDVWNGTAAAAFLSAFVGTIALWWLYFGTSSKDGTHVIAHADDPGRIGARFHQVHVILIAGIIVSAVANELVLAHPDGHLGAMGLATVILGPAIYLVGNAIYKRVVYGAFPVSHFAGTAALLAAALLGEAVSPLALGLLTTIIMLAIAAWDNLVTHRQPVTAA